MPKGVLVVLVAILPPLLACGEPPPAPPVAKPVPVETRVVRLLAGGDSRDDSSHVLPWAFREAHARGAAAFLFLGDMELSPQLDRSFAQELSWLDPIPFYPVLGNHEIKQLGFLPIGRAAAERAFAAHFLGNARTPVRSSLPGRVVYSVDLPGGVHFVALDNVSQRGFGADQLAWLDADLTRARAEPATKHVIVGMHQPLAHNGAVTHCMEVDGAQAASESDAALAMIAKNRVDLVLASHVHQYSQFTQAGIPTYVTGGLGAPLTRAGPDKAFHHFLQLDVAEDGIHVRVVRFDGKTRIAAEGEEDED
jgi:hypothetical protein